MKKIKVFSLLLVLVMLLSLLAACECKHEWKDATCEKPKTCSLCGKTEGEKLAHKWADATTEAPKTCSLCGKTEGEKITTDPRFKTDACKDLFGTWKAVYAMSGADMELADFPGTIEMEITMTFHNDGKMETSGGFKDPDAFKQSLCQYLENLLYKTYEGQGMNKEQADAAFLESNGKSIADYVAEQADQTITSAVTTINMVYYVADGKIYAAEGWDKTMEPQDFTLEDGVLKMQDPDLGETLEFHPAAA